jgi:starch phosphorylase
MMDIAARLRDLGRNLYWAWHPEILDIFRDLDSPLWRDVNHNPVEFLSRLPDETIRDRARELAVDARIAYAFNGLRDYLQSKNTWGARHAGSLWANSVAYFSAEFGLHESLPTYAGGLGVLAGDHLKAASDLGLPLVGVGLFYAKGYFNQTLDSNGWQKERYFDLDVNLLPLEQPNDEHGQPILISVHCGSRDIRVGLWTARVGRCRLILLDTNVQGNTDEDRALTSMLYGGDVRTRIRQEVVLGVGGMRALHAMGIRPGVIHLNEGHSAFAVLEMARDLMEREGRTFMEVRERVAGKTVFTTHTPVEAGHDRFEPALLRETLARLRQQIGLSENDLLALGRKDPLDKHELFCMTILGLKMSRSRNAVSALHGRVSRAMWRDLWPDRPESEVPIGHITNGVHVPTWLAVPMAQLYGRYLGHDWQERMSDPETWAAVDRIHPVEFWEQHQMLKAHLITYVRRSARQQAEARGEPDPIQDCPRPFLDPSILTIGFARRFAGYKRADLLLRDLNRLDRLVNHPQMPVQIIYAGKAHPRDEQGKGLAQEVFKASKDPRFVGRLVFLENHDINVSRHLVQGVDLWLNTPYRPFEACGTSGQKVLFNGGLNLSILDGWWAEAYDGTNGFAIGWGDENADWQRQDKIDLGTLYDVLEKQVIPLFYRVDEEGVPRGWVERQKNAIRTLAWRFSAQRMVADYVLNCYLPAAGALSSSCSAGCHCGE